MLPDFVEPIRELCRALKLGATLYAMLKKGKVVK